MAFKIALNAGHGMNTAGKRCLKALDPNETRENYLNRRICDKIEEKLKAYTGYDLLRLDDTTGKVDIPLKTRTNKANAFNADFYLAVHHNATTPKNYKTVNGITAFQGGGVIAIVYLNVDANTIDWQTKLYNAIIAKTGLKGNRSNPLQKQDLHEVRESKMAAVLLECGFMDSKTDVPIILTDTFADQVASACVEVLVEKGGLSKKVTVAPKPEVTAPVQKAVSEIAKEVLAGKWGNGADRKNRLEAAGYNYSEVQSAVNALCGKTTATAPKVNYYARYNGTSGSIVTALNSLKIGSSFANRKNIAKANGISLYIGTAAQNIKLLNLLKQGKLIKP